MANTVAAIAAFVASGLMLIALDGQPLAVQLANLGCDGGCNGAAVCGATEAGAAAGGDG